jgi:hypothetical protein
MNPHAPTTRTLYLISLLCALLGAISLVKQCSGRSTDQKTIAAEGNA